MGEHQLSSQPRGVRKERERHSEVHELLTRFAHALTAGDADTIATLWAVPAFVISADAVHAVDSREQVAKFFGGARAQYNALGVVDTRPDIRDEDWIDDRLVIVKVRWPWLDASGNERNAESSDYTLRRNAAGVLEIACVVMRGVERS